MFPTADGEYFCPFYRDKLPRTGQSDLTYHCSPRPGAVRYGLPRLWTSAISTRQMTHEWPHITNARLLELWERHAPDFIRLDDVERELPAMRESFLGWLEEKGVELGPKHVTESTAREIPRRRVRLEQVGLTRKGSTAETLVAMSLADTTAEAKRTGPGVPDEIVRMTAEATLDALRDLLPDLSFGLELAFTVEPSRAGAESVAVVLVRDSGRGNERYVGACAVVASAPEAAAKATLQAINRRTEAGARG